MAKAIKNHEVVTELLNTPPLSTDLAYCREYDNFYLWENYYYKEMSIIDMHDKVHNFVINRYPEIQLTESVVRDLIYQLKRMIFKDRKFLDYEKSKFAFGDCYFDTDTFKISPTTRDKLVVYSIPYAHDEIENFEIPLFYKYLRSTIVYKETGETDEDLIELLQEMFGFFIMDSLKATGAFFLTGTGSNGKSVLINVLLDMIGQKFCSSMSIQTLTTKSFAMAGLIGKKLNISNEEESKHMKSDVFKALITGDPVTADRKFQSMISFQPRTKYLFASNEMPKFDRLNHGLKRRIKIIPFYREFSDEEADKGLTTKLKTEMPGIVAWAIEGAKRLVKNDYVFSRPQAMKDELAEFEAEVSSVVRFVSTEYEIDETGFISNAQLYEEYKEWCEVNGKQSCNSIRFHKEISAMPNVKQSRRIIPETGNRAWGKNLNIKTDEYEQGTDTKTQSALLEL